MDKYSKIFLFFIKEYSEMSITIKKINKYVNIHKDNQACTLKNSFNIVWVNILRILLIIFSASIDEVELAIIPYFIAKDVHEIEDIYFDLSHDDRMGSKHNLEIQIYTPEDKIEYTILFTQFVVDDELTVCLPKFKTYNKE